jgi:hypothetical protein
MMYESGLVTHLTKIQRLVNIPISYFSDFDNQNDIQFSLNNNLNIVNQLGLLLGMQTLRSLWSKWVMNK